MSWKLLIPLLALSACNSTSLPMNEGYEASRRATVENEFETYATVVRSFVRGEDGERQEVAGAVCSARNANLFIKNVKTPAKVEIPMYLQAERFANRGKPPSLNWTCSYQGKVVKLSTEPASGRGHKIEYGASSYNAATGTYSQPTSLVLTGRLSSTLPWGYPGIEVEF